MTKAKRPIPRITTGGANLDALLGGGLPKGSVSVISGPPGSGKTILTQQLCFSSASPTHRILYFNTLSEPTAKTLRYLKQFDFFDAKKLEHDFQFVDLGGILGSKGLGKTSSLIMDQIKKVKPAVVVIDSFKVFDDLAHSREELRKFAYEIGINLMAWEATGLLVGEYSASEYTTSPLFSVMDGLLTLSQRESSGEQQRFLQVVKMRGTEHSRDEHAFAISSRGVEVFAPRVVIHREPPSAPFARCKTGIEKLDDLIIDGIPRGSSLLIAGVAGTGKTVLSLEFVYRGALGGEKGILFSFEETRERLIALGEKMGWDLQAQMDRGMLEILFIPQPEILVESHLLMMREHVVAMGAKRVAIDSVSVFLHKIKDAQIAREKVFQLVSIVQNAGAVGFFATDVPYGTDQISRFGVEETVVDGIILLSSTAEGFERQRYLEVYKLRNTAHLKGRHAMIIETGGIQVFPRYSRDEPGVMSVSLDPKARVPTGVPGLDELLGGGLLARSTTLLAGSPGIGKSTFGLQFILEGARLGEHGLLFAIEENREQLEATADALGLPLRKWVDEKRVEIVHLSFEGFRAAQFLDVVTDRIHALGARRVFFDGLIRASRPDASVGRRHSLDPLVARFKGLGVTSILAAESGALRFGDDLPEQAVSPAVDNIVMLRYVEDGTNLVPALRIVKTRGSAHGRGTYAFQLGKGGGRVEPLRRAGVTATEPSIPREPSRPKDRRK